jgi:hypothetical protein
MGTVETTTFQTFTDFNQVVNGTKNPVQHVLDPLATGSIFKERLCAYNDGTNGCWGQQFQSELGGPTWRVWLYELRQLEMNMQRFESYGFRYNAGDFADTGIIFSVDGSTFSQNHIGLNFKIESAVSKIAGMAAALTLITMF